MKEYNYKSLLDKPIDLELLNLISKIHEYKGRQELFLETQPQILEKLKTAAVIQSTDASNRIEGIFTSDKRLLELVEKMSEPKNRNEQEIAGYRDVLNIIHESYEHIRIDKNDFLTIHNRLCSYYPNKNKGRYKTIENAITQTNQNGEVVVRFTPIPALMVEQNMESFYVAIDKVIKDDQIDPLLYIPCIILDFLCIHPFNDGNGRMSRLLTLLLLYKSGYFVGRYISIEMIVEKTKESYYDALFESSIGWHENQNDYFPFLKYLLGVILKSYEEFDDRHKLLINDSFTSQDRVLALINKSFSPLSKTEIVQFCPEISQKTIERALNVLKNENKIQMIGSGKNTKYLRN